MALSSVNAASAGGGGLRPEDQELLDQQRQQAHETRLFETLSKDIAEQAKKFQAMHDAVMAVISGISGR